MTPSPGDNRDYRHWSESFVREDDYAFIAHAFWDEVVDDAQGLWPTCPEGADAQAYSDACRFYRVALCVLVILSEEKHDPRLAQTRGFIEDAAFKSLDVADLREGMASLVNLLDDKVDAIQWSQRWYSGLGCEHIDTVRLTAFALAWMDLYLALKDPLHSFATRARRQNTQPR